AVIVPQGASKGLRSEVRKTMSRILAYYGLAAGSPGQKGAASAVDLQIIFDPAIKANYRQTLTGAVEKIVAKVQSALLLDELQARFSQETKKPKMMLDLPQLVQVSQKDAASMGNYGLTLNAVQHNVPAWSMFAMFFILFPLAGNFIKEREDGSMLRLRLISGTQFPVIAGKFIFYFCICLLQLILMIGVGLYVMPLIGLDRLALGTNYAGIAMTGVSVAMAATGYGLLIAVYFRTPQQALSFGSISVVILAAVGGVWVPVYVMPHIMQSVSPYSPLHWGLAAFNNLFLRNAPIAVILPDVVKLVLFSMSTLAASVLIHRSRTVT
ncbi:MAG: ABC transporter permease, partial [Syntrophales bacterium]|nr:ABC transporter permease [Syntrophales bacterium]